MVILSKLSYFDFISLCELITASISSDLAIVPVMLLQCLKMIDTVCIDIL